MKALLYIPEIWGIGLDVYLILIILSIPTFFFWRWLLKKIITVNKTRKITTWILTVLITLLIYTGIIMAYVYSMSYYPKHNFNRKEWIIYKEKRYELSENVIESKMLIGKTKKEVRQILGFEDSDATFDNWTYGLGNKPGLGNIDPSLLSVEFKNGKVYNVSQYK